MKRAENIAGRVDIVHVTPYMHPAAGGPPVVVDRLCRHLARHGWVSRVVTTDTLARGMSADWTTQYGQDYELAVFASRGAGVYSYSPQLAARIDAAVAESRLVHIHTLWTYPGWAAMRACRRQNVPFVVMPHGMLDPNSLGRKWMKKQLYGRFVEWPQLRAAAAMVYTHEEERRLAESSVPRLPQGFLVPLGADSPPELPRERLAEQFFQRFPQLQGRKLVLFLSRLHPKKGLDLLVPAFRSVATRNRDAHLVLVGPGDDDYVASLLRLVKEAGLADRVTFTGALLGQAKWEAMAAATMLVLPSYQENFALVVAEGMRLGLPIVLSRRVNIWAEVVAAGAGVACELAADSLASAMGHYLDQPALADGAGRQGQQLASRQFNWDRTASAMEVAYHQVLFHENHVPLEGKIP
jgi:glycosyltransferase involved in cell wall biosynthesis